MTGALVVYMCRGRVAVLEFMPLVDGACCRKSVILYLARSLHVETREARVKMNEARSVRALPCPVPTRRDLRLQNLRLR